MRAVLDQRPFRDSPCLLTCLSSLSALLMPTVLNFPNMYFHTKGYIFVTLMELTLVYLGAILNP